MTDNAAGEPIVAVRPMRREDVDALAGWGRHDDPLFRQYNVPALSPADADDMWTVLAGDPAHRRPFAGLEDGRVVASLVVREATPGAGEGELGIILDPDRIGRGLGRRILDVFAAVLAAEGFRRLHLEVAGYNGRALAAYRAAGFAAIDEYWADPEPGIDAASLLDSPNVRLDADGRFRMRVVRMERRLTS
jgi:RimJ/RimL family protein N-acetyltransferase